MQTSLGSLLGEVRNDITSRVILRMAHSIAVASHGTPDARERMLTIMFDGLRQPNQKTR